MASETKQGRGEEVPAAEKGCCKLVDQGNWAKP